MKGQSWARRDPAARAPILLPAAGQCWGRPGITRNIAATHGGGRGGGRRGAGWGATRGSRAEAERSNNNSGGILIMAKLAIMVFFRFINFEKSGLLTLLAY